MPRLSKLIEKAEDRLERKLGSWYERHKAKLPAYGSFGLVGWYFYGMFINSIRLGIANTFHRADEDAKSIWVVNPFRNMFAIFTPAGIAVTFFIVLMTCLITKKGFLWFSGYKYKRDPRGFDVLPDGTHGTSGFLTEREMREFLELGAGTGRYTAALA